MPVDRVAPPISTTMLVVLPWLLIAGCGPNTGAHNATGSHALQARPQATLRLAEEPTLLIGAQEGPEEYILHNIDGAASLADGSVAVAVRGSHQIRKYDSQGRHLWSQGRLGEGPGEYQGVMLLRGCTSDESIATYDIYNRRITKLDGTGRLIADYPLEFEGARPYVLECSASGRLVFSAWGTMQAEDPGPHRWEVPVAFTDSAESDIVLLRDNVPGQERVQYFEDDQRTLNGPRVWGRRIVLGATDAGAWLGTGDAYELEFLDWDGATVRRLRWEGPDLEVTREDVDRRREILRAQYRNRDDPNWRPAFQRRWDSERALLPSVFPAYSSILVPRGGGVWVESYRRPGQGEREWLLFDGDGAWARTLSMPARMVVLDAGDAWVLVQETDEVGVQRIAQYGLVASS